MKVTSKDYRFIGLAEGLIYQSNNEKYKLGAVLVKGGSVISTGVNRKSARPFFVRNNGKESLHAEIDCLYWIDKKVSNGCVIYISGRSVAGNYIRTRPCTSCIDIIIKMGVRKIYYHETTGEVICERVYR